MNLYQTPSLSIFFGTEQHSFVPDLHKGFSALTKHPFNQLAKLMNLKQMVFLNQVHSDRGRVITLEDSKNMLPSFVNDGDFLITSVANIGLAVATADCLPIIFYDKKNKVVGIAHAGWRGSVAQIGVKTVTRMQQLYKTKVDDIEIFFGPSAQACCYQVQEDFIKNLGSFSYIDQLINSTEQGLFFHLDKLNMFQLEEMGIRKELINRQYHQCTICNPSYCSVRRMPGTTQRQMTVVVLY
jgi:hypothetical protein